MRSKILTFSVADWHITCTLKYIKYRFLARIFPLNFFKFVKGKSIINFALSETGKEIA